MKEIDILPCFVPTEIRFSSIPINRYTGILRDELAAGKITKDEAKFFYRAMVLIRNFEYMVVDLSTEAFVPYDGFKFIGATHLYIGEEANAVGIMSAIRKNDYITSTHRGHGHAVAKGLFGLREMGEREIERFIGGKWPTEGYDSLFEAAVDYHLFQAMAELLGKEEGYCHGRGGGMHIADFNMGNLGANAIVGGSFAIATGAALAVQYQGEDRIVVCIIGDGAMNNGIAHEAMNFSTMRQFKKGLPIVYFIENNQYGMTGQQRGEVTGVDFLSQRGAGYNDVNMHAETICGMNVLTVREAMQRAREKLLRGEGPILLESLTYRFLGHNYKDKGVSYRSDTEKEAWVREDPVARLKNEMVELGIITEDEAKEENERARKKIEEITLRAANGTDPDIKNIYAGLYSDTTSDGIGKDYKTKNLLKSPRRYTRDSEGRILFRHAVAEALTEEMIRDRRVIIYGEDVADYGGAYQVTLGLLDIFGRERVFNTAISEAAIIGTGVGAAMAGLRPVVEIMYIDFILMAMDQLGNQAAKARYMFGGKAKIPLVIRTTIGGGKGYAGQHSQSLEATVAHIPGIKVVIPSTAYDVKGLLKTAIRDDNPVFFIEHQMLYTDKGEVPEDDYTIPFGVARVAHEGKDITVVTYSNIIKNVFEAGDILAREDGVSIEVIDPRTLVPLDVETIANSVNKTGRAVVVNQAPYTGSFASHIAYEIQDNSFRKLKAPVRVVTAYDVPPPMARTLENENIPTVERILRNIREVLSY
ncbi:MAG: alpha-ketoacid dehydrogenase subunit alpha/beta [Spirochaetota bacterium]